MWKSILNDIRDNWDDILEWTEIIVSSGALIVIAVFQLFGVQNIGIELDVLLGLLAVLGISRHRNRKANQAFQQSAEEAFQEAQALKGQQTTFQHVLQTLDTSVRDIGTNQSTLQQSVLTLSNSVKSLTDNKFYPNQEEAFKSLLKYASTNPVKEAIFLQYSGKQSEMVLYPLVLNKKAKATVYVQHEEMAQQLKSERQAERITSTIRNSLSDLSRKLVDPSNLKVYKFKTPASVRAIKIDDQVLCVGWYTYEKVDRKGWTYPDDQTAVSGDDRPTIVVWRGTEEYDILDQMVMVMVKNYEENAEAVPL